MNPQQKQLLRRISFFGSVIGIALMIYGYKYHAALVCAEPSTLMFLKEDEDWVAYSFMAGIGILIPSAFAGIFGLWSDVVTAASEQKTTRTKVGMYILFFIGLMMLTTYILQKFLQCE